MEIQVAPSLIDIHMFKATYFDNSRVLPYTVSVQIEKDTLRFFVGEQIKIWRLKELSIIKQNRNELILAEGEPTSSEKTGRLIIQDSKGLQRLTKELKKHLKKRKLKKKFVFLGLGLTATGALLFLFLPKLLFWGFSQLPSTSQQRLSYNVIRFLMRDADERCTEENATILLTKLTQTLDPSLKTLDLIVTNSPTENAFALPGNVVILHTGLITTLENGNELAAVLAHELGHLQEQHSWKVLSYSITFQTLFSFFAGDVGASSSTLAQFFLNNSFSQKQETEADEIALKTLKRNDLTTAGFISFFTPEKKEEAEKKEDADEKEALQTGEKQKASKKDSLFELFLTHPNNEKRIQMARSMPSGSKNALTPEEWKTIKNVCSQKEPLSLF